VRPAGRLEGVRTGRNRGAAVSFFVVHVAPLAAEPLAQELLQPTAHAIGANRVYRIYRSTRPINERFLDPFNGELLSELKSFATEDEAKRWAKADDARCRLARAPERRGI
jgi:hypothetical protein